MPELAGALLSSAPVVAGVDFGLALDAASTGPADVPVPGVGVVSVREADAAGVLLTEESGVPV